MADYDVGVIALTTPAASAPLAQTRPVVSVRNNGIHDAVASGYIRIYSAGLLVYQSEAYSDTIGPGETRPASAVDYWTPETEGTYIVQGYFSTPLDQVEPNNNLQPTKVVISGIVPPPPTPVALHASQHEEGGADELSIEDLPGRAADQQRPINHASDHELGGTDPVNVDGMPGVLAQSQTPKVHATSHKVGGGDGLSVLALPDATDLELIARKGAANGYAGLGANSLVPIAQLAPLGAAVDASALRKDQSWGPTNPVSTKALAAPLHITDNAEHIIFDSVEGPQTDGTDYHVPVDIFLYSTVGPNILTVELRAGVSVGDLTYISRATFVIAALAAIRFAHADLRGQKTSGALQGAGITFSSMDGPLVLTQFPTLFVKDVSTATFLRVTAKLTSAGTTTDLWIQAAAIHKRTPA